MAKKKKQEKRPSVIIEKTIIDEENDRVIVREYDANARSNPPRKKQLVFDDPHDEGCISVDWSESAETILHLFGIPYYTMEPPKKKGGK